MSTEKVSVQAEPDQIFKELVSQYVNKLVDRWEAKYDREHAAELSQLDRELEEASNQVSDLLSYAQNYETEWDELKFSIDEWNQLKKQKAVIINNRNRAKRIIGEVLGV